MKKRHWIIVALFMAFVVSCVPGKDEEDKGSATGSDLLQEVEIDSTKTTPSNADFIPAVDLCGKQSVADFRSFMGFNYGDDEKLLTSKLGSFTKGNYASDSTYFIYYYESVPRVPIQVWVHVETGKIITVFIEVLSLKSLFNEDLALAKEEYAIDECEISFMGLTADQIIAKLGPPAEDAFSKDNVHLLTYDSEDFEMAVAFKIYPQENKCSSIAVNWFYDNH